MPVLHSRKFGFGDFPLVCFAGVFKTSQAIKRHPSLDSIIPSGFAREACCRYPLRVSSTYFGAK
jgi:hypothetical protein